MSEGVCQILVDQVGMHVTDLPGKPAAQDLQLLQVAGAPADAVAVPSCQVKDRHGDTARTEYPVWAGRLPSQLIVGLAGQADNPHNRNPGQLAQLVSWLALRRWPILSALSRVGLAALLWLGQCSTFLVLVTLGHLGISFRPKNK